MEQRRFWRRGRDWTSKKRHRKIEYNAEKGIYEAVELEEDVLKKIVSLLWYSGIPVFRERERIPRCPHCRRFISRPSDSGHPDLHGYIPPGKIKGINVAVPFYCETKRPGGGVQREGQKEFIKRACRDGVVAFFADSYSTVKERFAEIGVKLPDG